MQARKNYISLLKYLLVVSSLFLVLNARASKVTTTAPAPETVLGTKEEALFYYKNIWLPYICTDKNDCAALDKTLLKANTSVLKCFGGDTPNRNDSVDCKAVYRAAATHYCQGPKAKSARCEQYQTDVLLYNTEGAKLD